MMGYAMDQLRKEGVPEANLRAAAAHLVGQADMESGLNPNKSHDGGTGYGIYGARLTRRSAMFAWLKEHGYAMNSAEGQMREMAHRAMSGQYKQTKRILMNATAEGLGPGSRVITHEFESPKVDNDRSGAVVKAYRTNPGSGSPQDAGKPNWFNPSNLAKGAAGAIRTDYNYHHNPVNNTSHTQTHIGSINVHTQATNGHGIASTIRESVANVFGPAHANYGLA